MINKINIILYKILILRRHVKRNQLWASLSQKVIWVNSQKKTLCWSKRLWAFWNIDIELRTRKSRVVWECQLPNTSSTSSRPYLSDVSFFVLTLLLLFFAEYCYSLSHVFRFRLFYPSRWPPTLVLYSHLTPSRECLRRHVIWISDGNEWIRL